MNPRNCLVHAVLIVFAFFLATNSSFAVWTGEWYSKDPYPDYATKGVPDFHQCLDNWGKVPGLQDPKDPKNNPQNSEWRWTWDGPVAWADSIWWMDSRFESFLNPYPVPPPAISDSFDLVSAAAFIDDHDPANVDFVVGELANLFYTDGNPWCSWNGTTVPEMLTGLQNYLLARHLAKQDHVAPGPYFVIGHRTYPAFYEIVHEVKRCQDVILLLGFYEESGLAPGEYNWVGGHYVAVTAVNEAQKQLRISDPFLNLANPSPTPIQQKDAGIVSYDPYTAADLSPLGCSLKDYPWTIGHPGDPNWDALAKNFKGVNPSGLPTVFVTSPGIGYLTLVEHMIHLSPEWDDDLYIKPPYVDYVPAGVPDFDQRQDSWGKVPGAKSKEDPENNPQNPLWRWTWCGPVALANSLWWLDSKMEEIVLAAEGKKPVPPPEVSDHFPLLRSLGLWDDHHPNNVQPFVSDLAGRASTDGAPWCAWLGTKPADLQDAVIGYLKERGLYFDPGSDPFEGTLFEVGLTPEPTFEQVSKEIYRCQDVILLLGFYEYGPSSQYLRVGGHYVTCAGVDRRGGRVLLSDPVVDGRMPTLGLSGKDQPLQPPVVDPQLHNDAAIVSREEYHVATLSDNECWLTDYPWSVGPEHELFEHLRQNFNGVNPSDLPVLKILHSCEYITKVEYMLHVSPVFWYEKPPHHDYAQAGVPDFSQKQDKWGKNPQAKDPNDPLNDPKQPGWKWTWCGPVAIANSLWWLDSQFETLLTPIGALPVKPPVVNDHFPLVATYLANTDDHHAANVQPLVGHLATLMLTDGSPWCAWTGTRVEEMVEGIKKYLQEVGLGPGNENYKFSFEVGMTKDPDLLKDIAVQLRRCQDVVLLLGFYRFGEGFYTRVGGHFVTAVGVNEKEGLILVSDPWLDTVAGDNGPSGPGRFGIPHDPVEHDPGQHNDADFVSHDVYSVGLLSDKENYLENYPWSDMGNTRLREQIEANFGGTNIPKQLVLPPEVQPVGQFMTKIEYMVHVSPVGKPVPVAVITPLHAGCGQTITFDGSGSYHTNPARSIVRYEWDFDGDGQYDTTGPVVSYAYPTFGVKKAALRVTDDDTPPVMMDSFFDVFVDVGNHPPVADPGGPYAIDIGQNLLLDGSGSSDPDASCGDSIVSYEWDLNNDGVFIDAIGPTPTVPWAVLSGFNLKVYPETNTIALRVKDTLGLIDTEMVSLSLYSNEPVAVFTATPNPAPVGTEVTFDASGSYHGRPDRSIVSYEWDLDGDSLIDATKKIVGHVYLSAGTYNVTLTVRDDNTPPKSDSTSQIVRVLPVVPPEEIAAGLGNAGRGWFEIVNARSFLLTHSVWKLVPWWRGETRPAMGDFDGDGQKEVVVGLGGGGGGRLAVFDDITTGYAFIRWLVIPWAAYNARNGESWPACGDVDGDSKDEIVVGLGPTGGGWFHVFNDAGTGYASMAWRQLPPIAPLVVGIPGYNAANGETRPAVGDIDGDGKEEVVIGLGPYPPAGGWFCLFDDGLFGFPFRGWRRIPYPAYNSANGETWPVTGDIDGDAKEEIVVGLGTYPLNGGWMSFFDNAPGAPFMGWRRLPWAAYNGFNGETHPATAKLDADAPVELVVGLGNGGLGRMWIADDWTTGVVNRGWYWIPWGGYAWAQGLSYPRAKALTDASAGVPELPAQDGENPPEPHETLFGSISGNVSSGEGPVDGAWVTAYSDAWTPLLSTRSDGSGNYILEGLLPGAYFVEAAAETNLAPEYYDNVPGIPSQRGSATLVNVYAAVDTDGINFDLGPGATISGTVIDQTSMPPFPPLPGAIVTAYVEGGSWEMVAQAEAGSDGNYVLQALPAGKYYLEASAAVPGYLSEYYDNVPAIPSNQSKATAVAVGAGENVTGKNFALGRGSSISGTVRDQISDVLLEGAIVILYTSEGAQWQSVASTLTSGTGAYVFSGLPAGTYYLEANKPGAGYGGEYYNNVGALVMNRASATSVVLGENASATGKDFGLVQGGAIAGTVTSGPAGVGPIEGVVITVYEQDWGAVAGQTTTGSDGKYSVGNLPTGNYRISADGAAVGYSSRYYDNQPMTEEGKALAASVPVTAGAISGNKDFSLPSLTSISGMVRDDSDTPTTIAGAIVSASKTADGDPVATATSADNGTYQIKLEAGTYYVRAEAFGYAREYFHEASDPGAAQSVSPTAGNPVTSVDFTLSPVGTIRAVSNVQSAPFTLSSAGLPDIQGNTGQSRVWIGQVRAGLWKITWGAVPGFETPPQEEQYVQMDEVTFTGHYTLSPSEGIRVHALETVGTGTEKKFRILWYSEVGKMYRVQAIDDLGPGPSDWHNLSGPYGGVGGMMSYEVLMGQRRLWWFRVRVD